MRTNGHWGSPGSNGSRRFWIAAASALAAVLFWAATSNVVYDIMSPAGLSWHVVLRKGYSIAAFALLGFTADKALGPSARPMLRAALLVAAYSAAIEVAQAALGSNEGRVWNAVDVLCGGAGGALGVLGSRFIARSARR
ncbi:MAG: VanZ family protein [Candidatus Eremiobacteraeota bacterium]|nr:VanZ family protein [Candidatus Eremiobacteraeota bacterium]